MTEEVRLYHLEGCDVAMETPKPLYKDSTCVCPKCGMEAKFSDIEAELQKAIRNDALKRGLLEPQQARYGNRKGVSIKTAKLPEPKFELRRVQP